MKQRLSKVKFFHAIEVTTSTGKTQISYFDEKRDDSYQLFLADNLVKITYIPTNDTVYSSLHNVVYFGVKE